MRFDDLARQQASHGAAFIEDSQQNEALGTPPRGRPLNPSSKVAFGSYFNVNVAAYVTLPLQPARYRIKIEYAGHESNEAIIAIVERS